MKLESIKSSINKLSIHDVYDELVKKNPSKYYQIVESPAIPFEENVYVMKSIKFDITYDRVSDIDLENCMYVGLDEVVTYLSNFDYGVLLYNFSVTEPYYINDCREIQVKVLLRFCELKERASKINKSGYGLKLYNKDSEKMTINKTVIPLTKNKQLILDDEVEIVEYDSNDVYNIVNVCSYNIELENYDLDTLIALPGEINHVVQKLKENIKDGVLQVSNIVLNQYTDPNTFVVTVRFILYYKILGE